MGYSAVLRIWLVLLAIPAKLLDCLGLWKPLAIRFFPYMMATFVADFCTCLHPYKKKLFSRLPDFAGPSGQLKVLELGCGTGTNFQFYPRGASIICTDVNPHFQKFLKKSKAENDHLHFERDLATPGENLSGVSDASVDVVVSTQVLCSATSVEALLKEVLRVLRPHGAFFFMDHVCADHSTWTYICQKIYEPFWKCLFAGCNLCREPWKDLEKAQFSEVKLQHMWLPYTWLPVRPHIVGYAIK
ncbi:thiol S-methyltransferase TMT1A-like [Ambystoma mexicanum]|uniref:thiol S-methyltransferase TMT1A-like n=1 Tax=Ambystoma mexicanum TaxID=8296 RepID=UPI0037E99475